MVAQCLRQEKKENPGSHARSLTSKKDILDLIKNKDFEQSQKIVAQTLNLKIKTFEKKTIQKDESVRIEMTLNKNQFRFGT